MTKRNGLKTEQYLAIKWLSLPNRGGKTIDEVAEICGVTRRTIQIWNKDVTFSEVLDAEIKAYVENYTNNNGINFLLWKALGIAERDGLHEITYKLMTAINELDGSFKVELEVLNVLLNAYNKGLSYNDIREERTDSGASVRGIIADRYNSVVKPCLMLGIEPLNMTNSAAVNMYYANLITKEELDSKIKELNLKSPISRDEAEKALRDEPGFMLAIERQYNTWSYAQLENDIKPTINPIGYAESMADTICSLYSEEKLSANSISLKLGISSSTIHEVIRESGLTANNPFEYKETLSVFTRYGHEFERILGGILAELQYSFVKYEHEQYKPDFVIGKHWIDAKLSVWTKTTEMVEKYEPHCEQLSIIFLRGSDKYKKSLSEKTTKQSVYRLIEDLPADREEFYRHLLKALEKELETEILGATS